MIEFTPFTVELLLKERVWGGYRLGAHDPPFGEAWIVSEGSPIGSGDFAGMTLAAAQEMKAPQISQPTVDWTSVVTDLHARTDVPGLYAIGETACTGLHGANRLASNSLLECLVFAEAAAQDIRSHLRHAPADLPTWDESRVTDADEAIVISHNWDELRRFMWDYVGIVRTTKRLQRAQHRIRLLAREIDEFYSNFRVSNDLIELRNLVVSADLIVRSALKRKESRGLHFSRDYPETLPKARDTVLRPRR